jgi:hypothetical protein
MNVAWDLFTPWSALLGGVLIGLASAILVLFDGRIAGISGILAGLLPPANAETGWRLAFTLGLVAAPLAVALVAPFPHVVITASRIELLIAGLLVGFGTRLGSGCTSGHGVCGLSRLSPRSLAATGTFMAAGFVTVFVVRHVLTGG